MNIISLLSWRRKPVANRRERFIEDTERYLNRKLTLPSAQSDKQSCRCPSPASMAFAGKCDTDS